MSLALQSPRRSALSLLWQEDFRRAGGYTSIAKQGGVIVGTVLGINDGWLSLGGAGQISYSSQRIGGLTEISFGAWVKDTNGAGYQSILTSTDWVTSGFALHTPNAWANLNMRIAISGTVRTVSTAFPGGCAFIVCTWESGEGIRGYVNGVENGISAVYAGTVSQSVVSPLVVGSSDGSQYLAGKIKDPFIIGRQLSAAEVLALYNNSTLR